MQLVAIAPIYLFVETTTNKFWHNVAAGAGTFFEFWPSRAGPKTVYSKWQTVDPVGAAWLDTGQLIGSAMWQKADTLAPRERQQVIGHLRQWFEQAEGGTIHFDIHTGKLLSGPADIHYRSPEAGSGWICRRSVA